MTEYVFLSSTKILSRSVTEEQYPQSDLSPLTSFVFVACLISFSAGNFCTLFDPHFVFTLYSCEALANSVQSAVKLLPPYPTHVFFGRISLN